MKTAVICYSLSGNTIRAAEQTAEELGADLIRLEPVKAYPVSGFMKYFRGGRDATLHLSCPLKPYDFSGDYDCVIFAFPVWAACVTPPLRTFIAENMDKLRTMKQAAVVCQSGSGAEKALAELEKQTGVKLSGRLVLIDPLEKPDPENNTKIHAFCVSLKGE
ncbi:MAG: hypothetical protein IJ120_09815 [Solobacterium sp.]|nr:hypothetical protein [Solobacterium sp.]